MGKYVCIWLFVYACILYECICRYIYMDKYVCKAIYVGMFVMYMLYVLYLHFLIMCIYNTLNLYHAIAACFIRILVKVMKTTLLSKSFS